MSHIEDALSLEKALNNLRRGKEYIDDIKVTAAKMHNTPYYHFVVFFKKRGGDFKLRYELAKDFVDSEVPANVFAQMDRWVRAEIPGAAYVE